MENMTYVDVYGCNPTAPYHQVPSSPLLQILGRSHLSCVKIDIVRCGAPKHWVELVRYPWRYTSFRGEQQRSAPAPAIRSVRDMVDKIVLRPTIVL